MKKLRTAEEIIEGNKLIGKFDNRLRFKNDKKNHAEWVGCIDGERGNAFMSNQLKYHSSWDWIMPVVEKISTLKVNGGSIITKISSSISVSGRWTVHTCSFQTEEQIWNNRYEFIANISNDYEHDGPKIDSIWLAVVEFIKWYNKQIK